MEIISEFRPPWFEFSNFWPWLRHDKLGEPAPVLFENMVFPSSEHAYQAAKTNDPHVRLWIAGMDTFQSGRNPAARAKLAGKTVRLCPNWESLRDAVMLEIVRDKFTRHAVMRAKLLLSGDAQLIEGNWWGDTYWGMCNGRGLNKLGKILMQVREELRCQGQ